MTGVAQATSRITRERRERRGPSFFKDARQGGEEVGLDVGMGTTKARFGDARASKIDGAEKINTNTKPSLARVGGGGKKKQLRAWQEFSHLYLSGDGRKRGGVARGGVGESYWWGD